ncbi:MAG: aspartate/glutamate racemase family protein [bacterium]|nr:aspartate/glutamate racemase family protein [bacterium]
MKTIGMLGGMSWESSLEYYRIVNEEVKSRLGGFHSAKCLMYSVDFAEIEELQHKDEWKKLTQMMIDSAIMIEKGGADFLVICTNTMHLMAEDVADNINIPLIHIADAAAEEIKKLGLKKVGLLGTKFTMEKEFYKVRLKEKHGIETIIPDESGRQIVHDGVYNEFTQGTISDGTRLKYREVIRNLADNGAEAVVLGCTEIPLFIKADDSPIPLMDTTTIHAVAAVDFALK